MSEKRFDEKIENLRKVTGTLPSEQPIKKTNIVSFYDSVEVTLEDYNKNPYKTMFVTSTSTWGNNEFKQKWPETSPEARFEVVKAVLTNNTLPQAREMVNFIFRVKGVPRWLFDIHTQIPFTSFMSIGCRDNNKLDADIVTNEHYSDEAKKVMEDLKDLYEYVTKSDRGSWQAARTFLPQSYSHSYHFGQNLLSIYNTQLPASANSEDIKILFGSLYGEVLDAIEEQFPLIGFYLQHLAYYYDSDIKMKKPQVLDMVRDLEFKDLSDKDKELFNEDYKA